MIDITEFLKTGIIANYNVGVNPISISNLENFKKHYQDEEDESFGYSVFDEEIELTVSDDELTCVSVDVAGNHVTILFKFNITTNTSLDQIIDFLLFLELEWEFNSRHSFGQQLTIDLKSGVQISFRYEEGYGLLLSRIQKYSF